jgi:hypothetical protein
VDGDQHPGTDELVELDVVHMPAFTGFGRVEHDLDCVLVNVALGHCGACSRVPRARESQTPRTTDAWSTLR